MCVRRFFFLVALVLHVALLPVTVRAEATDEAPSIPVRRFSFHALDDADVMRVRPTEAAPAIVFGRRLDETVTKARLIVKYLASPVLIPLQSHVRVVLNGELAGVLPITRMTIGRDTVQEIDLDPRLIGTFNRLKLEFVAHYTSECEDPLHLGLWVDVARGSELQLTMKKVGLDNDLALLPQPFFDSQDHGRLELPYVFASQPSNTTLRAAAITASWFGKLASWRGARFPAYLDTLPKGHAVVFATNQERPALLAQAAPFTGPALSIVTNPADGYSKLLLVTGRDGNDLRLAANALVLGTAALSGTRIEVRKTTEEAPRKAYDAPNWVRLDRPMKFGELVESPQQLQVFGHVPDPIRLNVRIPPDLFTWRSRGVPVDLRFRYTPPIHTIDSTLSMEINDELVQTVNLRSSGQGGESARVVLPLLDSGLLGEGREVLIPSFKLGARNQLKYAFSFSYLTAGACRDTQIENVQAMIDADSSIDFTGYPHYAEMPHLGYFATAGFPFTKYADLSQTAVVMPVKPGRADIETMLALVGRMGESTGYPATQVTVAGPGERDAMKGKDLLLIGAVPNQSLLDAWSAHLPAIIAGPQRKIRKVFGIWDWIYGWFGISSDPPPDPVRQKHVRGDGPLAAMLGFESPLEEGRSVVAVTAVEAADMGSLLDLLNDEKVAKTIHGSVALVYGGKVESLFAGKTYTLGSLPVWTAIWFPLSGHPVLLAFMAAISVLVFAFALWRTLRAVAARRLQSGELDRE
jgi:hypothetical protein